MQLQILRFSVDLPRENCSATILHTLRFFVTSLYFSLNSGGFRIQRILRKLRRSRLQRFFTLYYFLLPFGLPQAYQTRPPNSTNSAKMAKNRSRNDFSHYTISQCFFPFLTYQTGLPNSTYSLKSAKNSSFSTLYCFSLRLHHLAERPM